MRLQQAERKQAKIKLGIQGPAGSGKTYSSLLIAFGMTKDWTKIAVVDTENHSADLYAHLGAYNVLTLDKPYSPERYIEAIEICEKAAMQVIILDSISHEWEGIGGILDIHGAMMGNSFTNWSKVTPRHNDFVQKLIQSPCHIIATIRSKQDYVLSERNGKMVPEKVGLKGVTREGMDYEFTLVFDIDIKHQTTASKDRTNLFMDKPSFQITEMIGEQIKHWCGSGQTLDAVISIINQASSVDELRNLIRQYPDYRSTIEPLAVQRKLKLENPIVEQVNP
ncbi:MAG: AAA family ATPase [Prolixibacteraceae bacterium]